MQKPCDPFGLVAEHSDGTHFSPITPVSKSLSGSTHPFAQDKTLGAVLDVSFLSASQGFSYCALPMLFHLSSRPVSPYLQDHCQGSGLYLLSPGPQHLLYCPCPCLQYGSLTPNPCYIMVAFIYCGGNAYLEVKESFCICIYFFLFSPVSPPLLSFLPFSLCYTHIQPSGHYVWCFLTLPPPKREKRG